MVLDTYIFKNFLKRTMETNISVILKKKKKERKFLWKASTYSSWTRNNRFFLHFQPFRTRVYNIYVHIVFPLHHGWLDLSQIPTSSRRSVTAIQIYICIENSLLPEFVYRYFAKRKFYHFETVHITHLVWRSLNRMLGIHKS